MVKAAGSASKFLSASGPQAEPRRFCLGYLLTVVSVLEPWAPNGTNLVAFLELEPHNVCISYMLYIYIYLFIYFFIF